MTWYLLISQNQLEIRYETSLDDLKMSVGVRRCLQTIGYVGAKSD
jgi:hypothetical protein